MTKAGVDMHKLQRLSICIIFLPIILLIGCDSSKPTPAQYLYKATISDSLYDQDVIKFENIIQEMVMEKEGPFYPARFEHTSEIYIDSILYSPNYLKSVFFVITKNSNQSVPLSEDPGSFHYNARTFLAKRDSVHSKWDIKWFRIINLSYYSSYDKISTQMQKRYFDELKDINTSEGVSIYKYNVNDIRFWDGPAWQEEAQMLEQHFSGDGGN